MTQAICMGVISAYLIPYQIKGEIILNTYSNLARYLLQKLVSSSNFFRFLEECMLNDHGKEVEDEKIKAGAGHTDEE